MGLAYEMDIYTPHSQFWPTLEAFQNLQCEACDDRTDLIALARQKLAPFGGKPENWTGGWRNSIEISPTFYFALDDRIIQEFPYYPVDAIFDNDRIYVEGCFHLYIHSVEPSKMADAHCIFRFGAETTRSSRLLAESPSMRNAFIKIAVENGAYGCYLGREETGTAFWLDGEPLCEDIGVGYIASLRELRLWIKERRAKRRLDELLRTQPISKVLIENLGHENEFLSELALRLMCAHTEDITAVLTDACGDPSPHVRKTAVELVGKSSDDGYLSLIVTGRRAKKRFAFRCV